MENEYDINEVQELFQGAVQGITRHFVISEGIIAAVSDDGLLCDVDIKGATFFDVPVRVLENSRASLLEKPTVGAICLLMFRDGNLQRPQLFMCDKADIQYNDIPQIIFHGGQLGGMVKVIELTERLNLLENAINNLIQVFNTHTHISAAQGSPTSTPTPTDDDQLTPTNREDIENTTITQ